MDLPLQKWGHNLCFVPHSIVQHDQKRDHIIFKNACAIVGCTVDSKRCKGVAFHSIPKGVKNKEWRAILIAKISRCDKGF